MSNTNIAYIAYSNNKPVIITSIPRLDTVPSGWLEATPKNALRVIVSEYNRGNAPPSELLTILQLHFEHPDADAPQTTSTTTHLQIGACNSRINSALILEIDSWLRSHNYRTGTIDIEGDNVCGVVTLWITDEKLRVDFLYAYTGGKFTMKVRC